MYFSFLGARATNQILQENLENIIKIKATYAISTCTIYKYVCRTGIGLILEITGLKVTLRIESVLVRTYRSLINKTVIMVGNSSKLRSYYYRYLLEHTPLFFCKETNKYIKCKS